jgi:hypothetical protein
MARAVASALAFDGRLTLQERSSRSSRMKLAPKRLDQLALAALVVALVFVLVDQAHDTGLQKGHRGWCSANVLAIIERATPQNWFVGYTLENERSDGTRKYVYFDRYPVFFSAGMHVVLNVLPLSRGDQIYVARQAMNVLYGLTLLAAVAFLLELGIGLPLAVAAVALAGSGALIVSYRDMIHFDHAAMLGFMGLMWAIARWYRARNDRLLYAVAAVAVLLGRGYASFAVLGVWWIAEAVRALRSDPRGALRAIALSVPTRACLLVIALAASCLSYNIWREAELNDIPIAKVGIVDSAQRRFLLQEKTRPPGHAKVLAWPAFSRSQAERFVQNIQPFYFEGWKPSGPALWLAVALCALAIGAFIAKREATARIPLLVASLAGIAWIFAMRGLTAFHDFTIMFMLSATVVLMASVLRFLPERAHIVAALAACGLLMVSTAARNRQLEKQSSVGEAYTADFARIEALLEPGVPFWTDPERKKLVPGVPYALGWYLPDNPISQIKGPLLVSSKKKHAKSFGTNLTPENKHVFLYRR